MLRCPVVSVIVRQTGAGNPIELDVEVREGRGHTRHRVSLEPALLAKLGHGASAEAFVAAAFAFLLEREPKESILTRFDVSVIARYFPEFDSEIGRYLKAK